MFDGIYFAFPYIALLIIPFIFCAYFCKLKVPSLYFPQVAQFMKNSVGNSKILFFLKWVTISLILIAFMSPLKDEAYELEPKKGHELAIIIDASQSMQAQGFDEDNPGASRFDIVKSIVSDFIRKRKKDNMGLVVFGAYSFIASPLTYDEHILSGIVSQLRIGMAGKYTALYESLAQGVHLLKMSESESKVAILLTDGYSTQGVDKIPLDVAIEIAKKEGVRVYPIGIGMKNEYNSEVLMKIAKETDGIAFGASNANELKNVYEKIDALEKSDIKNETFSYVQYYYRYPLTLAFITLMLYVYLKNRRRR